jgi:integration host factor subunit alpha
MMLNPADFIMETMSSVIWTLLHDSVGERFSLRVGLPKKESFELVDLVLEIMKETLEKGEPVKISGFGNFVVRQKRGRRGRNPRTGEDITITRRKVLTFKPSPLLKEAIYQGL